jgi:hypothetical protein
MSPGDRKIETMLKFEILFNLINIDNSIIYKPFKSIKWHTFWRHNLTLTHLSYDVNRTPLWKFLIPKIFIMFGLTKMCWCSGVGDISSWASIVSFWWIWSFFLDLRDVNNSKSKIGKEDGGKYAYFRRLYDSQAGRFSHICERITEKCNKLAHFLPGLNWRK